ncbi:MAG: GNAT family protein [Ktedonobacteraceae bacterium]
MYFTFTLMTEEDARIISSWQYEAPYTVYTMGGSEESDALAEMLDRRSPYYAVRDEHDMLIGFYCYGTSAHVGGSMEPGLFVEDRMVTIGLGLRPDVTGHGLGLTFVNAGLDFACREFAPKRFRLYVFAWNERALRVYERAGFQHVGLSTVQSPEGEREFIEMQREA